jgi:hypothetical protein
MQTVIYIYVYAQGYVKKPSKTKLFGRMPYVVSVNVREFFFVSSSVIAGFVKIRIPEFSKQRKCSCCGIVLLLSVN